MTESPVIVLVGPTASGKSSLAIETAKLLAGEGSPAEIINADSMLVYRGMDIGTAKPTRVELAEVPHHLVDIMEVTETATVAEFQKMARDKIAELHARGVIPIVVGGSSLYIRAIIDQFDFPGTDPQIRAKWQAECDRIGTAKLYAHLKEINPEAAAGILPGNGRRIVRALEVIELTGDYRSTLPKHEYAVAGIQQFGLRLDRKTMDQRIADRVEVMWQQGLVDEVRGLVTEGLREGLTASRGLGYQQVLEFLAGISDEETAKQLTIDGTRRFARKQLGWFKRDPRITWLEAGDPQNAETICQKVLGSAS